jgi:diaminobutyrate-2-oxoglutarate transaminase
MGFGDLSWEYGPLVRVTTPGARSKAYLDQQALHETSSISYAKGMPMALRRGRGATVLGRCLPAITAGRYPTS